MRYAPFLLLLVGLGFGAPSALAQQGFFSPEDYGDFMKQHGPVVPTPAVILLPAVPGVPTTAPVTLVSHSSSISCPTLRGNCCCEEDCGTRVFAAMEYLNWRATRDATPYAGTLSRPSGAIGGLPIDSGASLTSELCDTAYDRNSGFRAAIGYVMCDRWDVGFRYTYFSTTGASSLGDATVDSDSVLVNRMDHNMADDILNASFDDGEADFASQQIGLDFSTYDLEIRRQLRFDSQRFATRVMGGFRFAEINQDSQICYQNLDSGNLLTANTNETMNMSAVGLLAGGEAHYLLGWQISLFSRGAISLLYGNFEVSREDVQTSATEAGVRSISHRFQEVVPVVELNAGVRWQRNRFFAACGYDFASWFEMVQGMDAIHQDDVDGAANAYRTERGNLSFDGLFAEFGWLF